jgi:DNA-binding winged helix-turn-helix (wHTH) protein
MRQKTFQVLVYPIERRGTGLAKNQIISDVWKETAVVDECSGSKQ